MNITECIKERRLYFDNLNPGQVFKFTCVGSLPIPEESFYMCCVQQHHKNIKAMIDLDSGIIFNIEERDLKDLEVTAYAVETIAWAVS